MTFTFIFFIEGRGLSLNSAVETSGGAARIASDTAVSFLSSSFFKIWAAYLHGGHSYEFTHENSEAQKDKVISPTSHSK